MHIIDQSIIDGLTPLQAEAFDSIVKGFNIFLTGPGGTGKSMLIKTYRQLYFKELEIAMTSTTGVSALLLGGSTLHSYLGIGLGNGTVKDLTTKVLKGKAKGRWVKLNVLIIDEVSMMSPELFDKLEHVARNVRRNEKPFGGIQLIISGDFCQLPVVGQTNMCFEAESWDKCIDRTFYLSQIMRQTDDNFQTALNEIRVGDISKSTKRLLKTRVGVELKNEYGIKPTKLYSTNANVNIINERELDKLDAEDFYEYKMKTEFEGDYRLQDGMLEKLKKNSIIPETLQLCVGAQVMLIFNIDTEGGLVNGSRGVIKSFIENKPVVCFLNGREEVIDYQVWNFPEKHDSIKTILKARQIPLKLAWAFTIHKIQGATLDCVDIDLGDLFEFGQAYVALSRVKELSGLTISNLDFLTFKTHPKAVDFYKKLKAKQDKGPVVPESV